MGSGTTDVAVISLGGIVTSKSIRIGGDKIDEALVRYMRRYYNLMIGERTAEEIKIQIGTAYPPDQKNVSMDVRGRDLVTGLPKTITVTSKECFIALEESVEAIIGAVKEVLERTPPELSADILNKGIVMTGGGSLVYGFDERLSRETNLPVYVAEDPISCVALGTGKLLDGKF
jgi:rod shape-determining protein MreB